MKTLNYPFLLLLALVILAIPTISHSSLGDDCDIKYLEKRFKELNNLQTLKKGDSTGKYTYNILATEKKMEIVYGDTLKIYLDYDHLNDAKIINAEKDFLEVIFIGKEGKEKRSFLFIKGTEIRKLVPSINKGQNFRIKLDEDNVIFDFGNTFCVYNVKTNKFCP
ncbi:MAG: hypothetical protein WCO07_00330 [bacterium]